MKKYIGFIFCLILLPKVWATTVTATIIDSDSQTWNNGAWAVTLVNPRPDITPNVNGTNLTANQLSQSGVMSNSGVITVTLIDTSTISPINTTWQFTICPNASSSCGTGTLAVTGSSVNLSTQLSAFVKAPRFAPGVNSYGYLNAEVITSLYPGAIYYNVTSGTQQIYNKLTSTWTTNGGSSGAPTTCANTNNYPCLNTANVFTSTQTAPVFIGAVVTSDPTIPVFGAGTVNGIGYGGGSKISLISDNHAVYSWNYDQGQFLISSTMNYCINSQDNVTAGGPDLCSYRDSAGSITYATSENGGPAALIKAGVFVAAGTPSAAASQVGYGGVITANTNCGTLVTSAGCLEINVAGTVHYIPYY